MQTKLLTRSIAIAMAAGVGLTLIGCTNEAEKPQASGQTGNFADVIAHCEPSVSEEISDTIRVGVSSALSGPASAYGASSVGFRAFVDSINESGGIDGRQIEVTVLDDQLSPATAVTNVNQMISQNEIDVLAAIPGASSALALADTVERACIPNLFALAGEPAVDNLENPWTVKGLSGYDVEVATIVDSIKAEFPEGATIALMYANNEGGNSWAELVRDLLGDKWEVVAEQTIEAQDVAAPRSQVTSLASADADIAMSWLNVAQCAPFLQEIARSEWSPVTYQTVNCFNALAVMLPAGDAADGVRQAGWLRTFTPEQAAADPALADYLTSLESTDSSVSPASFASAGFAFGAGFVAVLEQAAASGTLSRASILEAANNLEPTTSPLLVEGVSFSSGPDHSGLVPKMVMQEWDSAAKEWVILN